MASFYGSLLSKRGVRPRHLEGKIQFKLALGAINLGPQEGMLKKGSSALTILRSGFLVRACREMRF